GGRPRLARLHLLHRGLRLRPRAAVADLEPVAAQLVPPVLALERPQLLVVLDLRARPAVRRGARRGFRLRRQLLLAAGDLESQAQRLGEKLPQLTALGGDGGAGALARGL